MDRPIEQFEKGGFIARIFSDPDPANPRKEYDNFGHMVCWHRRYVLGDKHPFVGPRECQQWLEAQQDEVVMLPLYLYDHSGITMNTTGFYCQWDSGQVGWIYVTMEEIRKEYGRKRISAKLLEKVRERMVAEVRTYDLFLQGECYGYEIRDAKDADDLVDSCWGYFGADYVRKDVARAVNALIKERKAGKGRK